MVGFSALVPVPDQRPVRQVRAPGQGPEGLVGADPEQDKEHQRPVGQVRAPGQGPEGLVGADPEKLTGQGQYLC